VQRAADGGRRTADGGRRFRLALRSTVFSFGYPATRRQSVLTEDGSIPRNFCIVPKTAISFSFPTLQLFTSPITEEPSNRYTTRCSRVAQNPDVVQARVDPLQPESDHVVFGRASSAFDDITPRVEWSNVAEVGKICVDLELWRRKQGPSWPAMAKSLGETCAPRPWPKERAPLTSAERCLLTVRANHPGGFHPQQNSNTIKSCLGIIRAFRIASRAYKIAADASLNPLTCHGNAIDAYPRTIKTSHNVRQACNIAAKVVQHFPTVYCNATKASTSVRDACNIATLAFLDRTPASRHATTALVMQITPLVHN